MLTSTLIYYFVAGYVFAASVDASEVLKCYSVDSENNYCFYTSGSVLSVNDAREFCESRNSTLPIITDELIDIVFQRFIVDDSLHVTRNRSYDVWIDAHAPHSDNSTNWRWINGRLSGPTTTDFHNNEDDHYWSAASVGALNGSAVLYQTSWNDNHQYVCQFDSQQSSSSTTSDQCSPRWIVYENQRALGGSYTTATTLEQCLRSCETYARCKAVEWVFRINRFCWRFTTDGYRSRLPRLGATQFELIRGCETSGANCQDAFQLDSTCYKVYKNETVPWLTAVNRCRSYNASLAVFSDDVDVRRIFPIDVRRIFPITMFSERAWIGLMKTHWYWPSAGGSAVMYNKFDTNALSPRDSDSNYSCAVAMATGQWKISSCDDRHLVVCQSHHLLTVSSELSSSTSSTSSTATEMMSHDGGFVLGLSVGLAVGLGVAVVSIVIAVAVVVSKCRRATSNGPSQNASEPSVSYAVSDKDAQPANDEDYNSLSTSTDNNNPHIYSQINRGDAGSRAVSSSYDYITPIA